MNCAQSGERNFPGSYADLETDEGKVAGGVCLFYVGYKNACVVKHACLHTFTVSFERKFFYARKLSVYPSCQEEDEKTGGGGLSLAYLLSPEVNSSFAHQGWVVLLHTKNERTYVHITYTMMGMVGSCLTCSGK